MSISLSLSRRIPNYMKNIQAYMHMKQNILGFSNLYYKQLRFYDIKGKQKSKGTQGAYNFALGFNIFTLLDALSAATSSVCTLLV